MDLTYTQLELEGLQMNPKRNKSTRPRSKADFYQTPFELAYATIGKLYDGNLLIPSNIDAVLDPGCGNGVWTDAYVEFISNKFPNLLTPSLHGIDINPPNSDTYLYCDFVIGDYLDEKISPLPLIHADLIIGNPPFSLMEEFIRRSLDLLEKDGIIAFLGRLEFLGSQKRARGLFKDYPPYAVWVSSRRPSFFSVLEGKHTTDMMEYAIFIWREGFKSVPPKLDWLLWEYDNE
jgi:SAM-dependent methyltransferase